MNLHKPRKERYQKILKSKEFPLFFLFLNLLHLSLSPFLNSKTDPDDIALMSLKSCMPHMCTYTDFVIKPKQRSVIPKALRVPICDV